MLRAGDFVDDRRRVEFSNESNIIFMKTIAR